MPDETTKILYCSCSNKWQDKTYGEGKRLHNSTMKVSPPTWRCIVCGKTKEARS